MSSKASISQREEVSIRGEDVLSMQDLDPALNRKMHLVNNVGLLSRCRARLTSPITVVADQKFRPLTRSDGPHIIRSCFSSTGLGEHRPPTSYPIVQ